MSGDNFIARMAGRVIVKILAGLAALVALVIAVLWALIGGGEGAELVGAATVAAGLHG